jgi:hypothetical protein
MTPVKAITNVAIIGGAGYVGYKAFQQLKTGISNKSVGTTAMAALMILVGVAALRHSFNKLSE